jgi:hypothetical protein
MVIIGSDISSARPIDRRDCRLGTRKRITAVSSSGVVGLGYAELAAGWPEKALKEFERAGASLPSQREQHDSQWFLASLAHGRALALSALVQQR